MSEPTHHKSGTEQFMPVIKEPLFTTSEKEQFNIFICYASTEQDFAQDLDNALRKIGRSSALRWDSVKAHDTPAEDTYGPIMAAETFIFIISAQSVNSELCLKQLKFAESLHKRIVSIVREEVETVKIPHLLVGVPTILYRETDDFRHAFQQLAQAVPTNLKVTAFICYSRKDKDFAGKLYEALRRSGRRAWIDLKSIPFTHIWMNEIHSGIEAADNFIFVITPDSVTSKYCLAELQYALKCKKRLIPLQRREVAPQVMEKALSELEWIPFTSDDDFQTPFRSLIDSLDADPDHVEKHTRLLLKALEWENEGRNPSFLLSAKELQEAERWLVQASAKKAPQPTETQKAFIVASRKAETKRSRNKFAVMTFGFVVAVILGSIGWIQRANAIESRKEADKQRGIAEQKTLVAEAQTRIAQSQTDIANQQTVIATEERNIAQAQRRIADAQRRIAQEKTKIAEEQQAIAEAQTVIAERERDTARRQALASAAYALADKDPTVALRFAERAASTDVSTVAGLAIVKAFNTGSWLYSHRLDGAYDADLSGDGRELAWVDSKQAVHLTDLNNNSASQTQITASNVRFLPTGNLVAWSQWNGPGTLGHVTVFNRQGVPIKRHEFAFLEPSICSTGAVLVPSFAKPGEDILLHVIDPSTAQAQTMELLPGSMAGGISIDGKCSPDGSEFALLQVSFPGQIILIDSKGRKEIIAIPEGYKATSIDFQNNRVAVYLAGIIKDVIDAVGWLEFKVDETADLELKVVPLSMSPSGDSGGLLRFLSDSTLIAASTGGWTRILNLDTGQYKDIDRKRAADMIAVSPAGNTFVLARRSGAATIYTTEGIPVGQLLGTEHSDGLNTTFSRLTFDATGQKLLTASREGIRIWQRPRYDLTLPHTSAVRLFDDVPDSSLRLFRKLETGGSRINIEPCKGTTTMRIDDAGQLSLCVRSLGRTDYLNTMLDRNDLDIVGNGPVENFGYRFAGEDADRLFVLSPEIILKLVKEEDQQRRLWKLDAATINSWAPQTSQ